MATTNRAEPAAAPEPPRTSVSLSMKVSLAQYENAELFLSVQNIGPATTDEEIDAALERGKLAYDRIRAHMRGRIRDVTSARNARAWSMQEGDDDPRG